MACGAAASLAFGLVGCAASKPAGTTTDAERTAQLTQPQRVPADAARAVPIRHSDGRAASWEELANVASAADVVLIGENHGHELGLAAAAALWEDVLKRSPKAVLAMEFFERDEQVALDDYLTGITDEAAFLRAAHRAKGNYPSGHRAMIESAKSGGRPVIAANAPRRYVRLARTDGYERLRGLTGEQARLVAIPSTEASAAYRAAFADVMDRNAGLSEAQKNDAAFMAERAKSLDASFRSQWMWDCTMGESVEHALKLGSPAVLVVGRFHVDHDGGTVQAVRTRLQDKKVVVVSFVDAAMPAGGIAESDRGRADFVIYVGPSSEQ